jgi:hypothetical protein
MKETSDQVLAYICILTATGRHITLLEENMGGTVVTEPLKDIDLLEKL